MESDAFDQEECIVIDGSEGSGGGGGGGDGIEEGWPSWPLLPNLMPKHFKGLRDSPPPFVRNLYEMVDDKETDSIISWGHARTSFIILDEHKFASEILPKYTKSNHFDSFITQLNNYGFKKICWKHREYANDWFQAGKQDLLKYIKRKNQQFGSYENNGNPRNDVKESGLESQLDILRDSRSELEMAMKKLEQKQEKMEIDMANFKEHIYNTVSKHQKFIMLMAKAINQDFDLQIVPKEKEKTELDNDQNENAKKRKLDVSVYENQQVKQDLTVAQSVSEFFECMKSGNDADEELAEHHSKIFMALEDLVENPANWVAIRDELVSAVHSDESNP